MLASSSGHSHVFNSFSCVPARILHWIIYYIHTVVLVNSRRFFPSPESLNVTLDTVAAFHCHHITADSINWEINGTTGLLEGMLSYRSGDGVYTLNVNVTSLPKYNHVMIKCVAYFDGSPPEKSHPALLMIQGRLNNHNYAWSNYTRNEGYGSNCHALVLK